MFGFLLQWPTLLTLAMFPILCVMYARLTDCPVRSGGTGATSAGDYVFVMLPPPSEQPAASSMSNQTQTTLPTPGRSRPPSDGPHPNEDKLRLAFWFSACIAEQFPPALRARPGGGRRSRWCRRFVRRPGMVAKPGNCDWLCTRDARNRVRSCHRRVTGEFHR